MKCTTRHVATASIGRPGRPRFSGGHLAHQAGHGVVLDFGVGHLVGHQGERRGAAEDGPGRTCRTGRATGAHVAGDGAALGCGIPHGPRPGRPGLDAGGLDLRPPGSATAEASDGRGGRRRRRWWPTLQLRRPVTPPGAAVGTVDADVAAADWAAGCRCCRRRARSTRWSTGRTSATGAAEGAVACDPAATAVQTLPVEPGGSTGAGVSGGTGDGADFRARVSARAAGQTQRPLTAAASTDRHCQRGGTDPGYQPCVEVRIFNKGCQHG